MAVKEQTELLHLPVDTISSNPENPRLIFDQGKLDILAESIAAVGILVPLIVYRDDDGRYVLLDGERRWRCARRLNLKHVPVNVIAKPSRIENILRMFNIHNVREEWELMPTALKLDQLIDELGTTNERRLSELTSLTIGTVRRCKVLLALPKQYQSDLLDTREFKADFFVEMDEKALRKLQKALPEFFNQYGRERLIDSFVEMQRKGMIKAVTDFRLLQKVLGAENLGLERDTVRELAERIIIKHEMDFQTAYDMIEDLVNVSKVDQKITRLCESIRILQYNKLKQLEKEKLRSSLTELRATIDHILERL